MTSDSLAQIWSLDKNAIPRGPLPDVNDLLLNELLVNRWGAHHLAILFAIVPTSETRLRNEGIAPLYDWCRLFVSKLKDILAERGIPVPELPDVPEDWKQEAGIDNEVLEAAMFPNMAKEVQDCVKYTTATTKDKNYHWSSLLAPMVVVGDVFNHAISAAKETSAQHGAQSTFIAMIFGDKSLHQYTEMLMEDGHAKSLAVASEEIMRVRSEAGKTGWREEEAKELSVKNMANFRNFFFV